MVSSVVAGHAVTMWRHASQRSRASLEAARALFRVPLETGEWQRARAGPSESRPASESEAKRFASETGSGSLGRSFTADSASQNSPALFQIIAADTSAFTQQVEEVNIQHSLC